MTSKERKQKIKRISDGFVKWVGSPFSLIVHTIFFGVMISLAFSSIGFDKVMLVLTTIVSLEAIYLSIFIQMTVNKHGEELEEVSDDIEEIQEDVGEIQKDVDEIQEDVGEIQKDVDEIQEDVDEIEEDKPKIIFENIEKNLQELITEISELKKKNIK
jgi:peptidoglycan hydrolase CwlO-like protein